MSGNNTEVAAAGVEPVAATGQVSSRYNALVKAGKIGWDSAQSELLPLMDALVQKLGERRPASGGFFQNLFGRKEQPEVIKGLYIWGSVGRGKTMLMDLFFDAVPTKSKRRVHFNDFMADAHSRIHKTRQLLKDGKLKGDDPIPHVANELADEADVLCFDEFAVTDIADAMILGRLFTVLFQRNIVVVATSNVEPENLYKDGLNRALFLPFISLLQERMNVYVLSSRTDFRLEKLGGETVFHIPNDAQAHEALDRAFQSLTGRKKGESKTLTFKGHDIFVPAASHGVARFEFADLCAKPLAAADYIEVARNFHTIILDDIPQMGIENRNEAKRFILLIDTLYERKVKLLASLQVPVISLYQAEQGIEAFEFDRTVSRLIEMQSTEYLQLPHDDTLHTSEVSTGLVET
ncbi:cell division protein ZapE [Microvirga sp. W0021]|uniref:Cell division protein ZapE n=1 Tax=Hohaiivirga grylli TaxID=3133970 RepID=A0ABV0BKS2_9HYPH